MTEGDEVGPNDVGKSPYFGPPSTSSFSPFVFRFPFLFELPFKLPSPCFFFHGFFGIREPMDPMEVESGAIAGVLSVEDGTG